MGATGHVPEPGALLGVFAGDALGARWEGLPPLDGRDGDERVAASLQEAPLTYTDDTQLTIALAEHLLEVPTADPQAFADLALDHIELWRGYGTGMRRVVEHWRLRVPFERAAVAEFEGGSYGNGAAMRAAPVGLLWRHDAERVDAIARRQAAATHAHPIGQDAAALIAVAVAMAARRASFEGADLTVVSGFCRTDELRRGLADAQAWAQRWDASEGVTLADVAQALGTGVEGHRSVPAALWAASVSADVATAVSLALGLGGDADTIASMAGGVRGAADGRAAIPREWQAAMVDDRRGRTYVVDLARRLAAAHDELLGDGDADVDPDADPDADASAP